MIKTYLQMGLLVVLVLGAGVSFEGNDHSASPGSQVVASR